MNPATVVFLEQFQDNSLKITKLREITGIEAVFNRAGESQTTRIRGIGENGMRLDLHAPHISATKCIEMMAAAKPGEVVLFDRVQLLNASQPNSPGMTPA